MELQTSSLAQDNLGISISHMINPTLINNIILQKTRCLNPQNCHKLSDNYTLEYTQDFARKLLHGTTNKSTGTAYLACALSYMQKVHTLFISSRKIPHSLTQRIAPNFHTYSLEHTQEFARRQGHYGTTNKSICTA